MANDSRPDLGAAAISGLRWSALARPLIEVVLFGSMIVLARLIAPAEFGRFAVALIITELAVNIPNEGVGSALVQRKEITRSHLATGFALTLLGGAVMAALTLVLAAVLVDPVFGAQTADLVRLASPTFLIGALATVPLALLRRRLAFGTLSVLEIASTMTRALVAVGLAIAGLESEGLVLSGLLGAAVITVAAWIIAPAPLPRLGRREAREILHFGVPASLASISWVGFRNCDYALIGARLGPLQAGYYFRAYSLAVEYQKKFSTVVGMLAFPLFSRTSDPEELARVRTQMVRATTILLFPLFVGLAILAPTLVPFVFGEGWAPAVVPTQLLALGGAATLVGDSIGAALLASGRPRAVLGYGWAHFLVYAGAVLLATPFGLAGVAAVASGVHAAFLLVAYWLLLQGSGEPIWRRLWLDTGPAAVSCLGFAAAAVPTSLALIAAGAAAPLVILVVGAAGAGAYLLTLRTLFPEAWRWVLSVARRVLPARLTSRPRSLAPAGANQAP